MTEYTKEQQAENRDKWTAALRSGNYKQGDGALRRDDVNTFCCLGVACDVAAQEGVVTWFPRRGVEDEFGQLYRAAGYSTPTDEGFYRENGVLPREVQEWLGLEGRGGALAHEARVAFTDEDGGGVLADGLTTLNDEAGYTFEQIADLIDAGGVLLMEHDSTN